VACNFQSAIHLGDPLVSSTVSAESHSGFGNRQIVLIGVRIVKMSTFTETNKSKHDLDAL
jgi:hypothetical protein